MGRGKYVHLDSYPETHETHPAINFLMALFVLGIAAITVGGILGIDVTSPSTPLRHVDTNRTGG